MSPYTHGSTPDYDARSDADVSRIQTQALRDHLRYCKTHSPFYRDVLADCDPERMTLADLAALPTTHKSAIAEQTEAFAAVRRSDVADIVFSSGTTGRPTQIVYSAGDLDRLAYNEALALGQCGVRADDVVLLTCTMDRCFVAGLAYFLGVRRLGAACIRNGHGSLASHAEVLARTGANVIIGVPSFLRKLGQAVPDARALGIRAIIGIGEPTRARDMSLLPASAELQDLWGAPVYSTYASSETITTFCECKAQSGGHLLPDLAHVEILDDADAPVPDGEIGEVVVTPFGVEGMPVLRFRTGDMSFLMREPCACGRVTPRLGPIVGRKAQMMKVRGTSVYPPAVFAALDQTDGVTEYAIEASSEADGTDRLRVSVSLDGTDAEAVRTRLQALLRVSPELVVEDLAALRARVFPASSRKPIRFVDRRNT